MGRPVIKYKMAYTRGEKPLISEKDAKNPKFSEDIFLNY